MISFYEIFIRCIFTRRTYPATAGLLCSARRPVQCLLKNTAQQISFFHEVYPCILSCPIYNGRMTERENNFKDISLDVKDISSVNGLSISYNKTNKLITALYIVTDILDNQEPLKNKLRSLANDILSDTYSLRTSRSNGMSKKVTGSIVELTSFLDIASTVGMLSSMNCSILKSEFLTLKKSIEEALGSYAMFDGHATLSDFFATANVEEFEVEKDTFTTPKRDSLFTKHDPIHPVKRHVSPTRLGVQKGSTLMKAISDKINANSNSMSVIKNLKDNTDNSRKERREIIITIIKNNPQGQTITDIKNASYGPLRTLGEKTLQRELVAMVSDNVLKKTGTKRWSRYYIL